VIHRGYIRAADVPRKRMGSDRNEISKRKAYVRSKVVVIVTRSMLAGAASGETV